MPQAIKLTCKPTGFSLLETVVSGFILSLIVIFMVSLFPGSLIAIQKSESRLEADTLASALIEETRHREFDKMVAIPSGQAKLGSTELVYRVDVGAVAGSDDRYLKQIRAVINWKDRGVDRELVREVWVHAVRR